MEIVKQENLPSLVPTKAELQAGIGGDTKFIPNMKLLQGLSEEIKAEENNAGDFYITSEQLNLGKRLTIVVIKRRCHALLIRNREKVAETFDIDSPLWNEIKFTKDDRKRGLVSFHGEGDWLLYLPDYELFTIYFCGKSSSRPLTGELIKYLLHPKERTKDAHKELPFTNRFELYSHFEDAMWGPKFKSFRPKVTPLDLFDEATIPEETRKQAIMLFYAPVQAEGKVEESDDDVDR